jgi:radical SAM protein with 4Fe4S-binding SPASM domain
MPPASLPEGHPLALDAAVINEIYRDAVEYSLDNITSRQSPCSLSFASRMMNTFMEGKPIENYCPAGFSTLSADAQGNVYPCFMFTGNEDFIVGNVFEENEVRGTRDKPMIKKIFLSDKTRNSQCRECWASPFCSGCIGADYFKTGERLEKTSCDLTKAMAEGFLAKVVNLMDKKSNEFSQITTEKGGENRPDHASEIF